MNRLVNDEPFKSQEKLIIAAGVTLFHLQLLELAVKLCCAFTNVGDKKATFENLFSEDKSTRHYTLGRLINLLKGPARFKETFVSRLDTFVDNRNKFIHKFWTDNEIYSLDIDISNEKYYAMYMFVNQLDIETIFMVNVFIGFNYSIGYHLAKMEGKLDEFKLDLQYDDMKQHLPLFLSVVEIE
jgi:hypothetical protein